MDIRYFGAFLRTKNTKLLMACDGDGAIAATMSSSLSFENGTLIGSTVFQYSGTTCGTAHKLESNRLAAVAFM